MKISPRQFPHPVYSYFSDDLINCEYQVAVDISATGSTYQFDVVARTSSKDLSALITSGKASYAIHIACSRTRYRDIFRWNSDRYQFHVQSNLLDGKVEVSRFIIAIDDIADYKNTNFHPDYGENSFMIKKGDILALNATITFDADKEVDPLRSIPSIFRIKVSKADNAQPLEVDYSSDKINIYLSEKNYRNFKMLKAVQNFQPVLSQMVVVPTLVSILERMMKSDSNEALEYEDLRWYRVLVKKLGKMGINPESDSWPVSPINLAQELIGNPISLSLDALLMTEED